VQLTPCTRLVVSTYRKGKALNNNTEIQRSVEIERIGAKLRTFTLIELVISVLAVSILIAIVVNFFSSPQQQELPQAQPTTVTNVDVSRTTATQKQTRYFVDSIHIFNDASSNVKSEIVRWANANKDKHIISITLASDGLVIISENK